MRVLGFAGGLGGGAAGADQSARARPEAADRERGEIRQVRGRPATRNGPCALRCDVCVHVVGCRACVPLLASCPEGAWNQHVSNAICGVQDAKLATELRMLEDRIVAVQAQRDQLEQRAKQVNKEHEVGTGSRAFASGSSTTILIDSVIRSIVCCVAGVCASGSAGSQGAG